MDVTGKARQAAVIAFCEALPRRKGELSSAEYAAAIYAALDAYEAARSQRPDAVSDPNAKGATK
jgi:hypothetical protein